MAELRNLHRKQGSIKAKLTIFRKLLDVFINNRNAVEKARLEGAASDAPSVAEPDPLVSVTQLKKTLEISKTLLEDYEALHDEIVLLESEDAFQVCYTSLASFQNGYVKAMAEASELVTYFENKLIQKTVNEPIVVSVTNPNTNVVVGQIQAPNEPTLPTAELLANSNTNIVAAPNLTSTTASTSSSTQSNDLATDIAENRVTNNTGTSIHLPVLNIPKFDGQCEQFNSFFASFDSLIHNNPRLPIMSKFLYLKSCLGVEPLRLIEHLDLLDGNYETALRLLEKRYKDVKLMRHTHLKAIVSCPPVVRANSTSLRLITDTVQAHIRALETLGEPVESWASIIQFLIIDKLDFGSKKEWEAATLDKDHPSLRDFFGFLEKRCQLLEKFDQTADKTKNILRDSNIVKPKYNGFKQKSNSNSNSHSLVARIQSSCALCKGSYYIYSCPNFLNKSTADRLADVLRLGLCENCLRPGHTKTNCRSQHCKKCSLFHSTLLHPATEQTATTSAVTLDVSDSDTYSQILPTAEIIVLDNKNRPHKCVALLDSGSQRSYITSALCNRLNLNSHRLESPIAISGINEAKSQSSRVCTTTIKSLHSDFSANLSFIVLNNIINRLSVSHLDSNSLSFPSNIILANPNFNKDQRIDVLLGTEVFWDILVLNQPRIHPCLQNTHFGYVVSGSFAPTETHMRSTESTNCFTFCGLSVADISRQLSRFWEIENILPSKKSLLSPEELQCEENFVQTSTRNSDGRFTVTMPLCSDPSVLGESRTRALKQFKSLEKRLHSNQKLLSMYVDFMKEYESLGHMTKVESSHHTENNFYLPHHAVLKEDSLTTKLRVVFNSSAQTSNGLSLNDIQLNGPVIQSDLFSILLRFRRFHYFLSADCTKMYRCVSMNPSQRPLQQILWRPSIDMPIETFQLTTVTYGQKCSSFLAVRCLFELANECKKEFPLISKTIEKDMYCDDLLTSCPSKTDASYICSNISTILSNGGFTLRKWNCNDPEILQAVRDDNIFNNVLEFGPNESTKTLGLMFNSHSDKFLYNVKPASFKGQATKRFILSFLASIFDPLGLISPCVVTLKIFMQKLWSINSSWDELLTPDLNDLWGKYCSDLMCLNVVQIDRQVICDDYKSIELHAFSDSSERAYGTCIYVKSVDNENIAHVNLLCSKTKVSPLKTITIPKLELCACLMMAELVNRVKTELDVMIKSTHYWTDSTIALSWISMSPHLLSTFVSNRVAQIHDLCEPKQWRYVSSKQNPADILSRGSTPVQLKETPLWWHGPDFLLQSEAQWTSHCTPPKLNALPELKTTQTFVSSIFQPIFPFSNNSTLGKSKRIMAHCLRFIENCKRKPANRLSGVLQCSELDSALVVLVKLAQHESFPSEMQLCSADKAIEKRSKLFSLTPFLSEKDNTLRIRSRLSNSSFAYDKKHPLILCGKHHLTKLIFQHYHLLLLHAGPQLLLSAVRERYWPVGGLNLAKQTYRKCLSCFRVKPVAIEALMGDLPAARVTCSSPFSVVGVDYCGPFILKDCNLKKYKTFKAYVCLFICFSTKALHLELVADLSTDAFTFTLRSFASRRGMPEKIYSDNGRNFVGAKTGLHELGGFLLTQEDQLTASCAKQNFNWVFLPPYAPNLAGIWEAGVKSSKAHFKRVIGNSTLTIIEFNNILVQIEGILNSRPLSPMSSNPTDYSPLTPAHFLIGRPLITVADPNVLDLKENRLSLYQKFQRMVQSYWSRWSVEYISQLQQRQKWRKNQSNLKIDQLVLIKEDNTPPNKWKLGRVTDLHPGRDGIVRVATIRTMDGPVRRALSKICPLPSE